MHLYICKICGAYLDPQEKCDCQTATDIRGEPDEKCCEDRGDQRESGWDKNDRVVPGKKSI